MTKTNKWYAGEYDLQCSGSPVKGDHRVWGSGCLYENDKTYILTKDSTTRVEVIPETLCVRLYKKGENFVIDIDGPHYIYEQIGPL